MAANGCTIFRYVMMTYAQKLTQVIKTNTSDFLRIQGYNSKILQTILKRQPK